ncbi:Scn10a, partial [Symbiodinium pilosum]
WFRMAFAAIFVVHTLWHMVQGIWIDGEAGFYFIYFARHSLILQTVDMLLLFYLSVKGKDKAQELDESASSTPCLARAAVVISSLSVPLSLAVVCAHWVFINPVWDLKQAPDYLEIYAHFINCVLLLVSLFVSRVPFSWKHGGWLAIYAALYLVWTYIDHSLRIGIRTQCYGGNCDCIICPMHAVLNWDKEGTAVAGTLVVGVGVLVVVITCGFLVRQRDRLDTQEDLKEWDKKKQEQLLLMQQAEEEE